MAGQVRSGSRVLVKPATLMDESDPLEVLEPEPYVSRGGLKLEAALREFNVDVTGLRCLDVGASTGGFTDCLLQHGAASVVAVDVGRAQLHKKLREDPRVTFLENTNARDLPELPPLDFFVVDVSFISLQKVLPSIAWRLPPATPGIVLLKPQFELAPALVPRGGVIRDAEVRASVARSFADWLTSRRWTRHGIVDSPVAGGDGNVEFLVAVATPAEKPPC
jgi:23S rRNA (cytidine1920-2'-O)/16S rRNA (cytidine1409-2'-O)-methyltransferase